MTDFEETAALSFQIIAAVGEARSMYIDAIHQARRGDFEAAAECMKQGNGAYSDGHALHSSLVQQEAAGNPAQLCLMLMHAEDQLMSAEAFSILAQELIDVYGILNDAHH